MPYADATYYKNTYQGTLIPDEELDRALERASDQIDCLTYNRIVAKGFDNLTEFQQAKVRAATCLQADFNAKYGDFTDLPLDSFSAGSISMSLGERINDVIASREALWQLRQTGLTSRRL